LVNSADILNAGILIVDDQEPNVRLLEKLLREAGYARVASTMDPHEVCALHRKNRYDLILLDLQMPGMDGFQVIEGLKTDDADAYLPVLVITAQPGHKLRALQAGARDFISKPFDLVEVKTRIRSMLEVRLLYKKLENNNKALERLDRIKNDFVSTVSHELRTPLTSIRGSLGVLASGVAGPLPDKARGFIEIARNNCERLIRLINDILDIEKIESGQMSFAPRPLDLMELVDQTLKADEGFAAQHDVRLQVVAAQPGAKVHADPDRLAQVVTNLISNACKFSPPGGTVDIAVTREGARLKVAVADRGPGITEEFLPRIFEPFSQADSSDARRKGGTGLGLSISKAIVERLGGEIGFTTGKGKATTFYFFLPECPEPAATASDAPPARPRKAVAATAQAGRALPGELKRILYVEDEGDIRTIAVTVLEALGGFTVLACRSGKEALEAAPGANADLILLDVMMPGMDGPATLKALREIPEIAQTPVIFMTAKVQPGEIRHFRDLGAIDVIPKPFDPMTLAAQIREIWERRGNS
jgi:signal transduction histidine kinase